jgi:hypothetical protein
MFLVNAYINAPYPSFTNFFVRLSLKVDYTWLGSVMCTLKILTQVFGWQTFTLHRTSTVSGSVEPQLNT